jgi:hypothetical protein
MKDLREFKLTVSPLSLSIYIYIFDAYFGLAVQNFIFFSKKKEI